MEIRQEDPRDYEAVHKVIEAAFAAAEQSDGSESPLVAALRNSPSFVPELSLVAVEDGKIVGHILFTRADVGGHPVLALAPLSVLPDCQRRGVGQALIRAGHRIAQNLGYDYSVVLGHPDYYPKTGYVPASRYGVKAPFDVPDACFMAARLNGRAGKITGTMQYDAAFGIG